MRASARPVCAILGCLAAACSSEADIEPSIQHPTLIEVAPEDFLGALPCSGDPGAVRSYVATLTDVTPLDDAGTERNFALPSSSPQACTRGVGFSFVTSGRKYEAAIDAYDRDDVQPLGPGLRDMVEIGTGQRVAPRWSSACTTPVTAVFARTRRARGCSPLADLAPSGDTAVRLNLESALEGLECGGEAGQIAGYTVRLEYENPELSGSTRQAPCGEEIVFAGLEPNEPVSLFVSASEQDALEPSWGTGCIATTVEHVAVAARCEPLTSEGAIEVDIPAVLADLGRSCAELSEVRVNVLTPAEQTLEVAPPACEHPLEITEIDVGELGPDRQVVVVVEVFGADGQCAARTSCPARVVPGQRVAATCQPATSCELYGG
jgi:hypothetical protein